MGAQHVNGWQLAGHEVVSVTDIDDTRAGALAERYGVRKTFTDYREAAADPDIDIVSICLPLKFHAPVTVFAAGQGKQVFCEKPLARSFAEVREMEAAVRSAGVQFGIGFQRNLDGDVGLLADCIRQGAFGRPLLFTGELVAEVRPKIEMHDRLGNNGPIMDACCHHFLLMQTLFGSKAKTVYAQGRILAQGRPELARIQQLAIDTAVVTIEFESGDIGTMNISWGLARKTKLRKRPDRLYGPLGGAELTGRGRVQLFLGDQEETVSYPEANLHQKQFALFADALSAGREAPVGFRQGKEMLALTLAAFRSIESGAVEPVIYDWQHASDNEKGDERG